MAYTTTIQIPNTPSSNKQSDNPAPSKAILRMALLKCVNGNILEMGCNQEGKLSIEKKVPASKNCGKVIRLAKGGIVLSVLATLLTIKPKPIKSNKAIKLRIIIWAKVTQPLTSVKSNTK